MEIDFEIEGALEIEKALNKLELRIEKNISRRAVGAGAKVSSRTHPLSPRTKRKPRKNGMPKGMAPRPFMRPAFDSQQAASIKAMADAYRQGIARGR